MKPSTVEKVWRAAEPYSPNLDLTLKGNKASRRRDSTVFLLDKSKPFDQPLPGEEESFLEKHLWIHAEDVIEIIMLSGLVATEESVQEACDIFRPFLPGLGKTKLCFEVCE